MPHVKGVGFIPYPECTVMSGDCFYRGRCLGSCRKNKRADLSETVDALADKVRDLEKRVRELERQK